ncbi:MAG TPA: oligosaccharide flippase family protein [Syntrophales bacterium]|nr:oligosaccharide flippase family protein [Syntrophales bacterium]
MGTERPKSISLRRNTVANYAGTLCQALLGFLFVPLYIRYLGVENYGLIGFSVSFSALLRLADFGLSATLSREFARYTGLKESGAEMRSLLKTLQTLYWGVCVLMGLVLVAAAPLVARHWIHAGSLDAAVLEDAVVLMGLTACLQGPLSLYSGGIFGLQRHVLGNVINVALAVARFGGVVPALAFISPTITVFFAYQLAVAWIGALGTGAVLWGLLPATGAPARFQMSSLTSIWRFAAGMSVNSVLAVVLFQLDKILLINILPPKAFGYYAVASTAAVAVTYLGGPLLTTFLPRYTQLFAAGDEQGLRATYRKSCRLNAVVIIPAAVLLAFFSEEALLLWTQDPDVARQTSLLLSLLVGGYGFNQLAAMPFCLHVASGRLRLGVYTNAAAVLTFVPALVIASRVYGGAGAAAVWLVLHGAYVLVFINLLHGSILEGEAPHWYAGTILPLVLAAGAGLSGPHFLKGVTGPWLAASLGFLWAVAAGSAALATSELRAEFADCLGRGNPHSPTVPQTKQGKS